MDSRLLTANKCFIPSLQFYFSVIGEEVNSKIFFIDMILKDSECVIILREEVVEAFIFQYSQAFLLSLLMSIPTIVNIQLLYIIFQQRNDDVSKEIQTFRVLSILSW